MLIGVVGGGVVGAAIAYTLSQSPDLEVIVWDKRDPHTWQATGAALGVLMAAVSPKLRGKHLRLRLESLRQYDALIRELQRLTDLKVPYNRQGILQLVFEASELLRWQKTQTVRHQQGFQLDILDREQLLQCYPIVSQAQRIDPPAVVAGGIYSGQDRQVEPIALTQALITAARRNGVEFHFQTRVHDFKDQTSTRSQQVTYVCTDRQRQRVDWLVLASGVDTPALATALRQEVPLQPVLGQALHLRLAQPMPYPHPVIHGGGIHLVPLSAEELWVGATVEFPGEAVARQIQPDLGQLERLRQRAIALYPPLADAEEYRTWFGLRPRPVGRPAPIIERLPGYENVIVATGHYRNGILLAPLTATLVQAMILSP